MGAGCLLLGSRLHRALTFEPAGHGHPPCVPEPVPPGGQLQRCRKPGERGSRTRAHQGHVAWRGPRAPALKPAPVGAVKGAPTRPLLPSRSEGTDGCSLPRGGSLAAPSGRDPSCRAGRDATRRPGACSDGSGRVPAREMAQMVSLGPFRVMRFLEDASNRGVLRTVGPVYQFRHARLQDRLAESWNR